MGESQFFRGESHPLDASSRASQMTRNLKVHLALVERPSFTRCGAVWRYQRRDGAWMIQLKAVDDPALVTCRKCRK